MQSESVPPTGNFEGGGGGGGGGEGWESGEGWGGWGAYVTFDSTSDDSSHELITVWTVMSLLAKHPGMASLS